MMRQLTGRRWLWECDARKITSHSTSTKQRGWLWTSGNSRGSSPPIHTNGTVVERVESFKFLGVHITNKLNWSTHTDSVVKVQQRLFNLRRLKKFVLSPKTLTNFYRCTIESILAGCITAWYGNYTSLNHKALQRVVRSAQCITCPPGHLHHPMSQEGQNDHQGHQPPEPLPVHTATIQKAR